MIGCLFHDFCQILKIVNDEFYYGGPSLNLLCVFLMSLAFPYDLFGGVLLLHLFVYFGPLHVVDNTCDFFQIAAGLHHIF